MSREISNREDIIDSRDVIERIEALEIILSDDDVAKGVLKLVSEEFAEERDELLSLQKLAEQCEGIGDWNWGEVLIRDDYFEEYAQQLAEDLDVIDPVTSKWPYTCIDWEKAADELKQDYMCVDFDGVEYWIRG